MSPQRVQRQRTKGWRMPANTIYVGRGSKWGNPYQVIRDQNGGWNVQLGRENLPLGPTGLRGGAQGDAVDRYRRALLADRHGLRRDQLHELRGKNLACWCPLDQPCHADVLLDLANRGEES